MQIPKLKLGEREFSSRLFVGTGKYDNAETMNAALEASGTEVVTVALRRVDLKNKDNNLLLQLDQEKYCLLPNTAGCYSTEDAVRISHLARELGMGNWIKLEVIGDETTLLPDPVQTLEATKQLVRDGFNVLAYTSDDPIMAMRLEDAGATSVMPAGAPIGSGGGIQNPNHIRIILDKLTVPVIVDAGVGTASDVSFAMELGAEAVLLNSAIALAKKPVQMAHAMKLACEAGYWAARSGRIPKKLYASASSPVDGMIS